jgi:hypothetical protein
MAARGAAVADVPLVDPQTVAHPEGPEALGGHGGHENGEDEHQNEPRLVVHVCRHLLRY